MANVVLPKSLIELFPTAPRTVDVAAATVREVLDQLDERWPGMRNRLCEPSATIRRHIVIFVDSEQATLATPVGPAAEVRIVPALSGG